MWKQEAEKLYKEGKSVTSISEHTGKSRKTISQYVNSLPELDNIKVIRAEKSASHRREYKRKWKRDSLAEAAMLRRQHEIDVMVLSREQYFNE